MIEAHPMLPEFNYIKPQSLPEATSFLVTHAGEAQPFMGGTDIFVRMRDGLSSVKFLVDVKNLDGMNEISYEPSQGLTIGAAVNMNRVIAHPVVRERYPVLAEAAHSVASYQLRTRATIIGNICNASPAGDTIGACLLLDGILEIHGENGIRQEPVTSFFLGPGQTRLKPGDIVTSIRFPIPPIGLTGKYIKLGRNKVSDLSIVGVTAIGFPAQDTPAGYCMKLALASVAPVPLVVEQAEKILSDEPIDDVRLKAAAQAAMEACTPIDDVRGGARYRKLMVRNLSYRALRSVWDTLNKEVNQA
jgi:carbon-monoxide dehydrogenase medium subunit